MGLPDIVGPCSMRQCFECDNCYGVSAENAVIKGGRRVEQAPLPQVSVSINNARSFSDATGLCNRR